jgi:hypothetical protein
MCGELEMNSKCCDLQQVSSVQDTGRGQYSGIQWNGSEQKQADKVLSGYWQWDNMFQNIMLQHSTYTVWVYRFCVPVHLKQKHLCSRTTFSTTKMIYVTFIMISFTVTSRKHNRAIARTALPCTGSLHSDFATRIMPATRSPYSQTTVETSSPSLT